jgi:hypothetical protein
MYGHRSIAAMKILARVVIATTDFLDRWCVVIVIAGIAFATLAVVRAA